jgi:predicted small secreted protein
LNVQHGTVGETSGHRPLWRSVVIALVIAGLTGLFLTGCNTAAGFGEDIQSLGRGLTNAADE